MLILSTCRKKTTIRIRTYNYALAEPITNANVVIIERKSGGGILSAGYNCKEIAQAVTDSKGECEFDKERLRTKDNYDYFVVINHAYGKEQAYPCGGKTSGYLNVGKTNEQLIHYSSFDAFFQIKYNHLLNPAEPGDSLNIGITSPKYSIPGQAHPFGGGGAFTAFPYYGANGYPFAAEILTPPVKTNAGKHIMYIYKRKMGLVTTSVDTVKIYPYETKIIDVNW